ncbi:unnamed protein product, partial [Prorocentrum cordatum]
AMVELLRKQYVLAQQQNDQVKMDEIVAACPEAKPMDPVEPAEPSMGQKLQQAVAELNKLQKQQDKLAAQLKRATEYRDDVLYKISTNVAELAEAKRAFTEAKEELGGEDEVPEAEKKPDDEEQFPTLSQEDLAMLDEKQQKEYDQIQKDYQQAKTFINAKKEAVQNAKKALDAAKQIHEKASKRRRGGQGEARTDQAPAASAIPESVLPEQPAGAGKPMDPDLRLAAKYDLSKDDQVQTYLAELAKIKGRTKVALATRQAPPPQPQQEPSIKPRPVYVKTVWIDDEVDYITESAFTRRGDAMTTAPSPFSTCGSSTSATMASDPDRAGAQESGSTFSVINGTKQSKLNNDVRDFVNIFVANCTQYNEAAKKFVEDEEREEYDIIAFNEHHLHAQGHSIFAKDFHDITIVKWQLKGQEIAVITAYLTASIGFTGENIRKMKHFLQLARSLGNTPWIICGDFNNAPQELEATPWLRLLGAAIVVPQHVSHTCGSGSGRMIDYALAPPVFRPLLKAVRAQHDVPWSSHIGIVIEILAKPNMITIRKPMLPAKKPIPTADVRREKGIERKQRDRQQHQEMAKYFDTELLDDALLDACYTETVAMKCDPTIWGEWVQDSLAYKQNPRVSDLLGKAYGNWANAAERALAAVTQNPIKAT